MRRQRAGVFLSSMTATTVVSSRSLQPDARQHPHAGAGPLAANLRCIGATHPGRLRRRWRRTPPQTAASTGGGCRERESGGERGDPARPQRSYDWQHGVTIQPTGSGGGDPGWPIRYIADAACPTRRNRLMMRPAAQLRQWRSTSKPQWWEAKRVAAGSNWPCLGGEAASR